MDIQTNKSYLRPPVFLFTFVAETALALWLLVQGVNVSKWQEKISAGGGPK